MVGLRAKSPLNVFADKAGLRLDHAKAMIRLARTIRDAEQEDLACLAAEELNRKATVAGFRLVWGGNQPALFWNVTREDDRFDKPIYIPTTT